MPQLNARNLPPSPVPRMIEVLRSTLAEAKGLNGPLNNSVLVGSDAVLKDANEATPTESGALGRNAPYIRIAYETSLYEMSGYSNIAKWSTVDVNLYFVYYIGKNAASVLPVEFTALRDQHIRWNIEHLKDRVVRPPTDIGIAIERRLDSIGNQYWMMPDSEPSIRIEHERPLEFLGITVPIPASSGFACSRADFQIKVMNHPTFTS